MKRNFKVHQTACFFCFLILIICPLKQSIYAKGQFDFKDDVYKIKKVQDFIITGDGSNSSWNKADWLVIPKRDLNNGQLSTRIKILYSQSGIYFLFDCADKRITTYMNADFMDLWKQDVVEVFLWPDQKTPTYFEYELSPLNYELPLLISNQKGDLVRWIPFHYDEDRKTNHATTIFGGEKANQAKITSWTAEFYIPFKLLRPLHNINPKPGTKWRANFYRVDYGDENNSRWSWQLTRKSFHDYENFGSLLFQ